MASELQSALNLIQKNDYVTLALVTAIVYDYFLNLSREIDYVWRRPWTWVSTMFLLVRYTGITWAVLNGFIGSTFVPGPERVSVVLSLVGSWIYPIFLAAADWVMILRVWTMWRRSKSILYVLVFIFVVQVVISFVLLGIYYDPNTHFSVAVIQITDFSFCGYSFLNTPSLLSLYFNVPRLVLGSALLFLAIVPTLNQSVLMYKATHQWQPNRYMQLFAREGIMYFLAYAFFNIVIWLQAYSNINTVGMLFPALFGYVSICTVMPRFIIGVRELYDRDIRGRWQGVDTGFGAGSPSTSSDTAEMSAIGFAGATPGQSQTLDGNADGSEGLRLEGWAGNVSSSQDQTVGSDADELEGIQLKERGGNVGRV